MVTSEAFEKWTEQNQVRFVNDFCDSYNAKNGTNFRVISDSLKDQQDFDFTLSCGRDTLKVQHTFAAADPRDEYIGPKLQAAVVAKLNNDLRHRKNISVVIGFRDIKDKKDAESLAADIEKVINVLADSGQLKKTKELESRFHYRYTNVSNPPVPKNIASHLTELRIYSSPYDQITFGYGGPVIATMPDDTRADLAIGKKELHYSDPSDLILIVHYNFPFFGDFFEPIIRDKHTASSFKGVWIFDAWKDKFVFIK